MASPVDIRYAIPVTRGVKAGTFAGGKFAGNLLMDPSVAAGALASIPSALGGGPTLDDITAAGAWAANAEPSWFASAVSGQWNTLPNSTYSTSPARWTANNQGGADKTSGITKYSGGILNTTGCYYGGSFHSGTFAVIWGGGHSDYGGNEVMAYGPLDSLTESPDWHRLTDPTVPPPTDVARDANGLPVSRHTYDIIQYLPMQNKMLSLGGGARYSNANSLTSVDVFDFATNTWAALPDLSFAPAIDFGNALGGYNPNTGKVWVQTAGNNTKLYCYDSTTGAVNYYTISLDPSIAPSASSGDIHPGFNLLVSFTLSGGLIGTNLATPSSPTALTTSGTGPTGSIFTLSWDAANNRFIAWSNTSGTTLYVLTPPSSSPFTNPWVWSTLSGSGGATPGTADPTGVYGRMQVVNFAHGGGVFLMPNATSPVVFYKY